MLDALARLERFYGPLPAPPHDPFALYLWEVLGVHTTPARRDAAFGVLKRIPALTPDSLASTPREKLEQAVARAGPHREERLRALMAGADTFRRHPDLPERLRGPNDIAADAAQLLSHLTTVSRQRLFLYSSGHTVIPDDPDLMRVIDRLAMNVDELRRELSSALGTLQKGVLYLSHHGRSTCVDADPLCRVCPLVSSCAFANG
jgi:endonuclease III